MCVFVFQSAKFFSSGGCRSRLPAADDSKTVAGSAEVQPAYIFIVARSLSLFAFEVTARGGLIFEIVSLQARCSSVVLRFQWD